MSAKYLVFEIGNQSYATPVSFIQGIEPYSPTTPVPQTPMSLQGIFSLRGKIIPVFDLENTLTGHFSKQSTTKNFVIVAQHQQDWVGFLVHEVYGVIELEESQIELPPSTSRQNDYLTGISKLDSGLVVLIDIEKTIQHSEAMDPFVPSVNKESSNTPLP